MSPLACQVRERCRADALLIRVKTVQSEPCFGNTANAPLSSQLDIIQERGGAPCKETALRSRGGGRKKARRAMPWGRIGRSQARRPPGGVEPGHIVAHSHPQAVEKGTACR